MYSNTIIIRNWECRLISQCQVCYIYYMFILRIYELFYIQKFEEDKIIVAWHIYVTLYSMLHFPLNWLICLPWRKKDLKYPLYFFLMLRGLGKQFSILIFLSVYFLCSTVNAQKHLNELNINFTIKSNWAKT